ncbi:hypothetical protein [Virgibacillus salexigens]|uniref:Uncharacterized protein n=1 Tax=Virgibacillus massiliensis TaxID=1462526 RepID=A0A024QHV5_9BACI|nr:hypothetical protein [Virgibacillus massiliensis]CDQ41790.1 hypothetical protein BN990_04167 [Virgibacillus massiliensis]
MPVYSERELIPFVNELEARLMSANREIEDWSESKGSILNSISKVGSNTTRSTTALVKADEALAEIGTATFDIVASRGQRLKKLIDNLKEEMVEIAKDTEGRSSSDPRINKEIDNAVSEVDGIIKDGLKLDYRLQKITDIALEGKDISDKDLIIPYVYELQEVTSREIQIPLLEGAAFVSGEVTVLDQNKNPILHPAGEIIHGTITKEGIVSLNYLPLEVIKLYFPVEMALKDVPHDIMFYMIDTLVQKNSQNMQDLLTFQKEQQDILSDIQAMQGQDWTVDFSIMQNHKEIIQEQITPKGLYIEIIDGKAHAFFSYNDHKNLSHFELEKWDEEQKKYVPFDGDRGIIPK